jgi:uncharacterized protein involved in response to NO
MRPVETAEVGRAGPTPALWSLAFRPFFLVAGLWASFALLLWIVLFMTVLAPVAGFMLTAIPNWTNRTPIQGVALAALAILWLLGRISCLISAFLPLWVAAIVDLAFPFVLCAIAVREIVAARNWRNLMMPLPIGVLGIANLLMYLELAGFDVPAGLGWRLGIVAIIVLITAIGGRIIPAFTRNWLVQRGVSALPGATGAIDRAALATLHTGLLGWAIFPRSQIIGAILLLGAALNLCRLTRWRGTATLAEPLIAILHVGYGWVVIGSALLGAASLSNIVPESAAIHAFTAGAIGTMVLAVMTRVSRGHTGRPLNADLITTFIYAMITVAAVIRVVAPFAEHLFMALLSISAALWIAAFGVFVVSYGSMLINPRIA